MNAKCHGTTSNAAPTAVWRSAIPQGHKVPHITIATASSTQERIIKLRRATTYPFNQIDKAAPHARPSSAFHVYWWN